jgi:hypothetical protein
MRTVGWLLIGYFSIFILMIFWMMLLHSLVN